MKPTNRTIVPFKPKHLRMGTFLWRTFIIFIGLSIVVSLGVYGLSTYMENQVIEMGKNTRELQEANRDLEIDLDQLKSFQQVAQVSEKVTDLKAPKEIIDVIAKSDYRAKPLPKPPEVVPRDVYGY